MSERALLAPRPRVPAFLSILPGIERHADIRFRHLKCRQQRADCIAECVALAWKWFQRLAEKGTDATRFSAILAQYATRAVGSGRRLCGQERAKDVMSPVAQRRRGFQVESLPLSIRTYHESPDVRGQRLQEVFEERLHDNTVTPVPDQVAFRVDWPRFYETLSERDRQMAEHLSLGRTAKRAADRFRLSPGRVTQLRQRWCREWRAFQGEEVAAEGGQN
jgi:hypothetical protein